MKKPKMVKDANQAWRWFSIRAMALAIALEGAWQAIPVDLKASIDETWRTVIVIGLLIGGVVGRLIDQGEEQ